MNMSDVRDGYIDLHGLEEGSLTHLNEKAVLVFVIGRVDVASEQDPVGNVVTVGRISRFGNQAKIGIDLESSRGD